jgi:hypothetical protein
MYDEYFEEETTTLKNHQNNEMTLHNGSDYNTLRLKGYQYFVILMHSLSLLYICKI